MNEPDGEARSFQEEGTAYAKTRRQSSALYDRSCKQLGGRRERSEKQNPMKMDSLGHPTIWSIS